MKNKKLNSQNLLKKIEILYDLEKYDECAVLCQKNLYINNEDTFNLYNYIILSYYFLDEYKKALKFCDEALGKYPDLDIFLYLKSLLYTATNNYKLALIFIQKALNQDPNNENYLLLASKIYTFQNNFRKAKKYIQKAIKINPYNTDLKNSYSFILFQLDEDTKAKEINNEVLKEDPFNKEALYFKQSVFIKNQKEKSSILSSLLIKNPFDEDSQKELKFINFYYKYIPILMILIILSNFLYNQYLKETDFIKYPLNIMIIITAIIGSRDWKYNIPFITILFYINLFFTHSNIYTYLGILFLSPIINYFLYYISIIFEASYKIIKHKYKKLECNNIYKPLHFLFFYPFEEDNTINIKQAKQFYTFISILISISLILNFIQSNNIIIKTTSTILFYIVAILSAKNLLLTIFYIFATMLIFNNFNYNDIFEYLLTAIFVSPIFWGIRILIKKYRNKKDE